MLDKRKAAIAASRELCGWGPRYHSTTTDCIREGHMGRNKRMRHTGPSQPNKKIPSEAGSRGHSRWNTPKGDLNSLLRQIGSAFRPIASFGFGHRWGRVPPNHQPEVSAGFTSGGVMSPPEGSYLYEAGDGILGLWVGQMWFYSQPAHSLAVNSPSRL